LLAASVVRFCATSLLYPETLTRIIKDPAEVVLIAGSCEPVPPQGPGFVRKEERMFVETTIRIHRKGLLENLPKPVLAALPKEHRKARVTSFADYVDRLDVAANQLNVRTLSSFADTEDWGEELEDKLADEMREAGKDPGRGDDLFEKVEAALNDQGAWHEPEDCLATVRALREYSANEPSILIDPKGEMSAEEMSSELLAIELVMEHLKNKKQRFRFAVGA
jgi:hypothetical protein